MLFYNEIDHFNTQITWINNITKICLKKVIFLLLHQSSIIPHHHQSSSSSYIQHQMKPKFLCIPSIIISWFQKGFHTNISMEIWWFLIISYATRRVPVCTLDLGDFFFVSIDFFNDTLHFFSFASSISICSCLHSWLQNGLSPLKNKHTKLNIHFIQQYMHMVQAFNASRWMLSISWSQLNKKKTIKISTKIHLVQQNMTMVQVFYAPNM